MTYSTSRQSGSAAVLLCLGLPIIGTAAAQAPAPAKIKIACVGDSITAGVGSTAGRDYPSVLAKLLGPQYQVVNFGESGATLLKHGDSPYWQRPSYAASAAFAPDEVVVMLGANDSKPQNWVHSDEFAGDYAALLDYYAALPTHPRLFVCLPTPVPQPNYGINEPVVDAELPIIRQVAAEKHAAIIDVHSQVPDDAADFVDGVHPNDAGYVFLASAVYQGLTQAPVILPPGGASFYQSYQVMIKPPMPPTSGVQVRYSTNGAPPTRSSSVYKAPFTIKSAVIVQAQTFRGKTPIGPVNAAKFTPLDLLPAHPTTETVGLVPGLAFAYFEGSYASVTALAGQTPVSTGTVPDFSLTPHKQETNFGFAFVGYINAPATGLYTFGTNSDDGSALFIDDQPVVNNDGLHGADIATGQVALAAGLHKIRVLYFQGGSGYSLQVTWQGPGFASQAIPATALSHAQST